MIEQNFSCEMWVEQNVSVISDELNECFALSTKPKLSFLIKNDGMGKKQEGEMFLFNFFFNFQISSLASSVSNIKKIKEATKEF